ncbi:MAG TPA: hypothetical protein PKB09_04285 [Candidatus Saccharibacteria bacterium]|nr:hypothetical protein [Candidatus Saccharibacteria bacterium]
MKKLNQSGFGTIEAVIVVVVVALIGAAGWYVVSMKNKETDTTTEKSAAVETPSDGCTAPAKEIHSREDTFSLCIPGGWELFSTTDPESFIVDTPFAVDGTKEAVVKEENIGGSDGSRDQFIVFVAEENYQGWTDDSAKKSTFVLNDGTEGTAYSMKHTNVSADDGLGPVEDEQDYEYLFEKNGKFIHAVYTVLPGTTNEVETVESVLKTLDIK